MSEIAPILIIVPTRNRPQFLDRLIKSWRDTTSGKSDLVVNVDSDTEKLYTQAPGVRYVVTPDTTVVKKVNNIAMKNLHYKYIMFLGDDIVIRTKGWEDLFLKAFKENEGKGIFYPDDLLQRGALPTHVIMPSEYIKSVGFMMYPPLHHCYVDNVWMQWGNALKVLKFFPNIIMEHFHRVNKKAPNDATYVRGYSQTQRDASIYNKYVASQEFKDHIKKLRGINV